MRIGVIGKSTRDKSFLMMYLGKLLSQGFHVRVVTDQQWFLPELESYEFSHHLTIGGKLEEEETADVMILDVCSKEDISMDIALYMSEVDRVSTAENERLFNAHKEAGIQVYLFNNILYDSKINEKYLCNRFGIDRKRETVLSLHLDDRDLAVHIENGYNDLLDIRGLTKQYKGLLLSLAEYSGKDRKTLKRWMKQAERSR